jgi:EPS-associated MarR family transcriptional regulator
MKNATLYDEIYLKLMRLVQANPTMQQRDIAKALGISLGKANSCINALVKKNFLKIEPVRTSENRVSHAYWLTPKGKAEKANLIDHLLVQKREEYELLKAEFDLLQQEK